MAQEGRVDGPGAELLGVVAETAGLCITDLNVTPASDIGSTNRNWIVTDGERRYFLREYCWPFDGPDDLDRPEKEAWLGDLLRSRQVPAPRVLCRVKVAGSEASLSTFMPGKHLGDVPVTCTTAWRSAGTVLARIHTIRIGRGDQAGMIAGRGVRPFPEGSWGRWHAANAINHATAVAERGEYPIDPELVGRIYRNAIPLLDCRPVRLLHNDPHPWNILVDRDGPNWQCTGWLDWEFAWTGDPAWDMARMDIFRLKDIGPTPEAFTAGYGSPRVPIVSDLYEFAIMLWMSNQAAAGDDLLQPTYHNAGVFLATADQTLASLDRKLA
jgi:aminoglycoside phosphotransferase (APT) family kinase protein